MAYVSCNRIYTLFTGIVRYRSFHAKDRSYEAGRNILIGTESEISAYIYSRYCKKINKVRLERFIFPSITLMNTWPIYDICLDTYLTLYYDDI